MSGGEGGAELGGTGGYRPPVCRAPYFEGCPSCPDGEPIEGACSFDPLGYQACEFGAEPHSTGVCLCTDSDAWYCLHRCNEQPPQGAPCTVLPSTTNTCQFAYQTCVCEPPGRWNCGCPYPPPADSTSCAEYDGLDCDYGGYGGRCRCDADSGNWVCQDCPETEPTHGDDCTGFPSNCRFPDTDGTCECDPQTNVWSCQERCGVAPPVHGDPCNGLSGWCRSGDDRCQCDNTTGTWSCVTCEPTLPTEGSDCADLGDLVCPYYDARCTCDATTERWSCEGECAPPVPEDGATCSEPATGLFCIYPGSPDPTYCVCDGNASQWRCLDCPSALPTAGNDCAGYYGRSCAYATGRCTCDTASDTWDCVDCPTSEPAPSSSCAGLERLTCQYGGGSCTCNHQTLEWSCR